MHNITDKRKFPPLPRTYPYLLQAAVHRMRYDYMHLQVYSLCKFTKVKELRLKNKRAFQSYFSTLRGSTPDFIIIAVTRPSCHILFPLDNALHALTDDDSPRARQIKTIHFRVDTMICSRAYVQTSHSRFCRRKL